jgi:hypothetical protein
MLAMEISRSFCNYNHQLVLPPATLLRSNSVSLVKNEHNRDISRSMCIISVPGFLSAVEQVPDEYKAGFKNAANFQASFDWRFPFSPDIPPTWSQWAKDLQNTVGDVISSQSEINHFVFLTDSQGLPLALMMDELSKLGMSVDIIATRVPYMGATRPGVISEVLESTIDDIDEIRKMERPDQTKVEVQPKNKKNGGEDATENRYLKNYRSLFEAHDEEPVWCGAARALRLFQSAVKSNISLDALSNFRGKILLLPYEMDRYLHTEEANQNFREMCRQAGREVQDVNSLSKALEILTTPFATNSH